jgi:hypothetical protein
MVNDFGGNDNHTFNWCPAPRYWVGALKRGADEALQPPSDVALRQSHYGGAYKVLLGLFRAQIRRYAGAHETC